MKDWGSSEKKKCVILGVFLVFALYFFVSVPVHAQVTGATLSGTVTDASGAVISGAQVSAKNTATDLAKETTTDTAGVYTLPNLPAGPYEVKVTAKGFNTAVSNLTLAVGAQQTLNVPMKVGETSQTVQVTEAALAAHPLPRTLCWASAMPMAGFRAAWRRICNLRRQQ